MTEHDCQGGIRQYCANAQPSRLSTLGNALGAQMVRHRDCRRFGIHQGRTWKEHGQFHVRFPKTLISSTFDVYESEVKSGNLEWSPPHLSDAFWKSNASKLNENDHVLLK